MTHNATKPKNIQSLDQVMIHFDNKKDEENGFYELMVSGIPISTFNSENGHRYLANALQLKILQENGINYVSDD
ncbi:MAG: hypothetical protein WAM14_10290 [Candidatus Nitrosopolaris sp.]